MNIEPLTKKKRGELMREWISVITTIGEDVLTGLLHTETETERRHHKKSPNFLYGGSNSSKFSIFSTDFAFRFRCGAALPEAATIIEKIR